MNIVRTPGAQPPRLQELDLLRLVAALMVVSAHYLSSSTEKLRFSLSLGHIFDWGNPLARIAHLGELGVDIFFMISGYVIAVSAQERSARSFLASRAARLLPAFWFCCALTWCLLKLTPNYRPVSLPQLLANIFLVARPLGYDFVDGVYWSLVVEVRFYLMVAALIWWRGMKGFSTFLSIWLVLAALDVLGAVPAPLRIVSLPQYAPYFIVGGAIFLIGQRRELRLAYGLCAGALALACIKSSARLPPLFPGQAVAISAVLLLSALILWLIATKRTATLGRPWMAAAGSLTYPLYLLHQDLGYLFMRYFPATGVPWIDNRLSISLAAILLFLWMAYAVVRFVEKPLGPRVRLRLAQSTGRFSELVNEQSHG